MNKKGFTLVELLAVIVVLAVILVIAIPNVIKIIETSKKDSFRLSVRNLFNAFNQGILNTTYVSDTRYNIKDLNNLDNNKFEEGTIIYYSGTNEIIIDGAKIGNYQTGLVSNSNKNDTFTIGTDSKILYDITKGVNKPALSIGMTPIKWDGTKWIDTTEIDTNWYDYNNQKWANARTADGSMWVWIPRYIYKIASGWHSNTTGTIIIQFSKGIDDNWNSSSIGNINTDTTSNASNNTWTNHPGFTFGSTELSGIWVAKFEATAAEGISNGYISDNSCPTVGDDVTTKKIKISPNVQSWRCITIGNMFNNIRNMETSNVYGWPLSNTLKTDGIFNTDTNNVDTHLMKNIEWGAVAYLSKSNYGQGTNDIYINNSQNFITGCAGNTVYESGYNGCQNTYESANGIKSSTTGTIYGIYGLSGGTWEKVAAYVDNGNSNLSGYGGTNIINANNKYKDVYIKGSSDDPSSNYALTINKKGDSLYETGGNTNGAYSWFNENAYMPNVSNPWFMRSGGWSGTSYTGLFYFNNTYGWARNGDGFRPVLLVGTGL